MIQPDFLLPFNSILRATILLIRGLTDIDLEAMLTVNIMIKEEAIAEK